MYFACYPCVCVSVCAVMYVCITSVDHKGVTCYGIRGRGVESRSLMTSVETRDLSGKDDRSRVNKNTKRVGKSRHVMGGCLLLLRFSMKRVSIKDRDSFSPATCVSTLVFPRQMANVLKIFATNPIR